jgi:hypothetical protein
MAFRIPALVAIAGISFACAALLRRAHRQQLSQRSPAKPPALQTWEGEGGGLPDGGPGVAAAPAAPAAPPTGKPARKSAV